MNEITFLELPVKFATNQEEMEKLESLGLPFDFGSNSIDGFVYVNPLQIESFNKDTSGHTTISVSGCAFKIWMKFENFIKMPGIKISKVDVELLPKDFDC